MRSSPLFAGMVCIYVKPCDHKAINRLIEIPAKISMSDPSATQFVVNSGGGHDRSPYFSA